MEERATNAESSVKRQASSARAGQAGSGRELERCRVERTGRKDGNTAAGARVRWGSDGAHTQSWRRCERGPTSDSWGALPEGERAEATRPASNHGSGEGLGRERRRALGTMNEARGRVRAKRERERVRERER